MKIKTSFVDVVRLIRFASILWIGYLAVLAIINQSLLDPRRGNSETIYYFLLIFVAVVCLGLSYWKWVQERLGRVFVPFIIFFITFMPMLAAWVIIQLYPRNPMFNSESLILKLLPFLMVGFLLVAWKYRWPYVLLIVLGITGLNIAILWSFPVPASMPAGGSGPPIRAILMMPLIQVVVFLAVGFSISYLIGQIRKQQKSLEDANVRLTHYASTLEHLTTARERNRLAREMHDTLAHTLSGLSVQLETIKAYWDVDKPMARSLLEKSSAATHSGLEETRRALKALRASPLDDLGLAQAVRVMVEDAAARNNLGLKLTISDNLPVLSPDVEQCIFRVAQEAVTNVVNHSLAKKLEVRLDHKDKKIVLTVADDGRGFNPEKNKNAGHFGLTGMQERAQLIGGTLDITSKPGQGTKIQLAI